MTMVQSSAKRRLEMGNHKRVPQPVHKSGSKCASGTTSSARAYSAATTARLNTSFWAAGGARGVEPERPHALTAVGLAGHSKLLTTQRYVHATGADLRDAIAKLPG
jgi:hypothetical protein